MSETIRDKIEVIIIAAMYSESSKVAVADFSTTKILELFPKWQTFSETCKPEQLQNIVVRDTNGTMHVLSYLNIRLDHFIKQGYQWYPIP
jgi:hypothetical protein